MNCLHCRIAGIICIFQKKASIPLSLTRLNSIVVYWMLLIVICIVLKSFLFYLYLLISNYAASRQHKTSFQQGFC